MEATQLWQAALNVLQQQVARKEFDTWLKTSAIADFNDGVVVVAMPNTFAVEWVENRTKPLIERTLSEIVGYPVGVRFVVRQGGGYFTPATAADRASAMALGAAPGAGYLDETSAATALAAGARLATGDAGVSLFAEDGIASSMPQRSAMVQTPDTQPRSGYLDGNGRSYRPSVAPPQNRTGASPRYQAPTRREIATQAELTMDESTPLNPKYVFEHFIVGASNRMAHAASMAVAEKPGPRLQSPLPVRRCRPGQDAPVARHRPSCHDALSEPARALCLFGKVHQRHDQRDPRQQQ